MARGEAARLLRKPGQPERATFLDLFFDLVFVFALTRVSQRLFEDVTSQRRIFLSEAGQSLLLLLALLLVWFVTAWLTDIYDPQQLEIQLLVAWALLGTLVMAVAVPRAFADRGMAFALAYVAIHIGRGLVLVPALRGQDAQRRAAAALLWFSVSAVLWILGAMFPESPARGALWTAALIIDYTGAFFFYPAPWTRNARSRWPVVAEYLSERYQQFFIIALGELILVIGVSFSAEYSLRSAPAFVVAVATTVLLWRIYIFRAGELMPAAMAAAPDPGRLVRRALLAHLIMVLGIVAVAVGYELVITHPSGRTQSAWIAVISGGPLLFLLGRSLLEYAVLARVSRSRVVAIVVLVATSPVMVVLPPLAVAATAAAVLAGVATADAIGFRKGPPEPPLPAP